jgi:DNA invertase Pin-like site-specific DNA recombinase
MKPLKFHGISKTYNRPLEKNRYLTEEQREKIIDLLEYYEPMSLREIAKECGTSNVTVLNIKRKYCKNSPKFYGNVFNYE